MTKKKDREFPAGFSIFMEKDNIVGRGSFGVVRFAERPTKDGNIERCVAKIIPPKKGENISRDEILNEVNIFNRENSDTGTIFQSPGGTWYIFQKYIPNTPVIDKTGHVPEQTSFIDRILIVWNLMVGLQYMNSHTLKKPATIHADIKPYNLCLEDVPRAEITVNEETIPSRIQSGYRATFWDFGLSFDADVDPASLMDRDGVGTPVFLPPEAYPGTGENLYSTKTDLYAMTAIIRTILDDIDAISIKSNQPNPMRAIRAPLKLDNLFEQSNDLPAYVTTKLIQLMESFLEKQGASNHSDRADINEAVRFWTTLAQYCLLSEYQDPDNQNSDSKENTYYSTNKIDEQRTIFIERKQQYMDILENVVSGEWMKSQLENVESPQWLKARVELDKKSRLLKAHTKYKNEILSQIREILLDTSFVLDVPLGFSMEIPDFPETISGFDGNKRVNIVTATSGNQDVIFYDNPNDNPSNEENRMSHLVDKFNANQKLIRALESIPPEKIASEEDMHEIKCSVSENTDGSDYDDDIVIVPIKKSNLLDDYLKELPKAKRILNNGHAEKSLYQTIRELLSDYPIIQQIFTSFTSLFFRPPVEEVLMEKSDEILNEGCGFS